MKIALVFSGQGSQYVGMGKELYEKYDYVRDMYELVHNLTNIDIANISFSGPKEDLVNTVNAQLAILTHSVSCLEVLKSHGIKYDGALGFSLGEYSALVASEVINFSDCVKIILERAKLMDKAINGKNTGMIAVIGTDYASVEAMIGYNAQISNYNTASQIVIGGYVDNLNRIDFGDIKHVKLDVSGAFHTSILDGSAKKFKGVLEKYQFDKPVVKLASNYTGEYYSEVSSNILSKQMNNTVLFYKNMELMINDGFDTFIELGPNRVLSSFVKMISKDLGVKVNVLNIEDIKSLDKTLKKLEEYNA